MNRGTEFLWNPSFCNDRVEPEKWRAFYTYTILNFCSDVVYLRSDASQAYYVSGILYSFWFVRKRGIHLLCDLYPQLETVFWVKFIPALYICLLHVLILSLNSYLL
jgi:hypothetical protein